MTAQTWPLHPAYGPGPSRAALNLDPALALFPGLSIWHKGEGVPYPVEDSRSGLAHAHGVGATAIDIDGQVSRERVPMATHWAQPLRHGYVDPAREIRRRSVTVDELTLPQLRRLIVPGDPRHPHRIQTLTSTLGYAAHVGLTICYEAKNDPRFEHPELWAQVLHEARAQRARLVVMTIQNLGGQSAAQRRLGAAHEAGLPTMLLSRGPVDWARWGPALDAVKGGTWVQRGAPDHVVRLGLGPHDATRYGASCHDGNAGAVNRAIHHAGGPR